MARGKSRSKHSRSERIEIASEYFRRGYGPTEVARKLKISRNTAARYKEIYEERLEARAAKNAHQFNNHPLNAQRMLDELEEARRLAFDEFKKADRKAMVTCEHCEEEMIIAVPDPDVKAKFLALILRAQQDRSKLFGALGVKADVLAAISAVKFVQEQMLKWMTDNLCVADREKLMAFLMSPEMAPYMGKQDSLPIIDGDSWELEPGDAA